MLNSSDIKQFIKGFYGYGNLASEIYFIGMEEGGGNSENDISNRINTWKKSGSQTLVDLALYSDELGANKFFNNKPVLQKTWNKLMRIIFLSEGINNFSIDELKAFQKYKLGRLNSNHALIELMPLPSPSTKNWIYKDISSEPYLKNRCQYLDTIAPERIIKIKEFIAENRPRFVVFYSFTYLEYWKSLAGFELRELHEYNIYYGKKHDVHYIISKHPVSFVSKNYFENIGKFIHQFDLR